MNQIFGNNVSGLINSKLNSYLKAYDSSKYFRQIHERNKACTSFTFHDEQILMSPEEGEEYIAAVKKYANINYGIPEEECDVKIQSAGWDPQNILVHVSKKPTEADRDLLCHFSKFWN